MTKNNQPATDSGDRPALEITPAMIEAGVKALYAVMGYQLSLASVEDGVAAALSAAMSEKVRVTPKSNTDTE